MAIWILVASLGMSMMNYLYKNLFLVQTKDEDQMMLMMMLINKMDGRLCVFHQMLLIAFHTMLSFYD